MRCADNVHILEAMKTALERERHADNAVCASSKHATRTSSDENRQPRCEQKGRYSYWYDGEVGEYNGEVGEYDGDPG